MPYPINWHPVEKALCENCKYYLKYNGDIPSDSGECRKRAPGCSESTKKYADNVYAKWPIVKHYNWCGEWEQKR